MTVKINISCNFKMPFAKALESFKQHAFFLGFLDFWFFCTLDRIKKEPNVSESESEYYLTTLGRDRAVCVPTGYEVDGLWFELWWK